MKGHKLFLDKLIVKLQEAGKKVYEGRLAKSEPVYSSSYIFCALFLSLRGETRSQNYAPLADSFGVVTCSFSGQCKVGSVACCQYAPVNRLPTRCREIA